MLVSDNLKDIPIQTLYMSEQQYHIDKGEILKYELTPEKYLRCFGIIARTGNLVYLNSDGTERIEVVEPSVLFAKDSIDSFKMKPITNDHPPVILDASNTQTYIKGMTGNMAYVDQSGIDASWLGINMTIFDKATIEDIMSGRKKELSCGYMAETEIRPDGKYYQLSRSGNHVSIVDQARASGAKVLMDSVDIVWSESTEKNLSVDEKTIDEAFSKTDSNLPKDTLNIDFDTINTKVSNQIMQKFTLDGISAEIESVDVAKHIKQVDSELANLRSNAVKDSEVIQKLTADSSTLEGKVAVLNSDKAANEKTIETLTAEIASLKAASLNQDSDKIATEIKARVTVLNQVLPFFQADSASYQPDYTKSVLEIQKEYLVKRYPKLVLDNKPPEFIQGSFEIAIASQPELVKDAAEETANKTDSVLEGIYKNRAEKSEGVSNADALTVAIDGYKNSLENAWKGVK